MHIFRKYHTTITKLALLSVLIFSTFAISSCTKSVEPSTVSGFKLNTYISITVYNEVDDDLLNSCLDLCDTYENMFSRTIETSTLSKLNRHEITEVPNDLGVLLQYGLQYGELSNGSFDLTIGGVSSLWDFTSETPQLPDPFKINAALSTVNYKKISLQKITGASDSATTYTVDIPDGTIIDLGAIAKGYIADRMKQYLMENGVTSAVINLGGNVLCIGDKPDGSVFHIGVKKPFSESGESLITLEINDKSVVSSGSYERCFTYNGKLYHHILNPKTGYPYDNNLTSVTIISDLSVEGDCLSTTCFTLGLDEGLKLIESLDGIEAAFITSDGTIHYSSGFSKYIAK